MALEISERLLLQLIEKIEENAHHRPQPDTPEGLSEDNGGEDDNHDPNDLTIDDLDQALDQLSLEVTDLREEIRDPQTAKVELETSEENTGSPDPGSEENGENTEAEPEDETSTEEQLEKEIECPQCGETGFQQFRELSWHNNSKEDHINPSKFFKGSNNQYYCFECGDPHDSRQGLVTHCIQEHDTKLMQYFLENFEDLKKGRVDGVYDYNGNVPELRKTKKIEECSRDELRRILPEHLEDLDHAQNLNQIALTCFDQELETGTSDYTKLYSCVEEVDTVKKVSDPNNPQRNAYYHETVET